MRIDLLKPFATTFLLILPGIAHAQYIPIWAVFAAISPLAVILMSIILGFLTRSWRVGAAHVGLVLLWVLLFGLASYFVENDYVIWTPMALYAVHAFLVLVLLILNFARRSK